MMQTKLLKVFANLSPSCFSLWVVSGKGRHRKISGIGIGGTMKRNVRLSGVLNLVIYVNEDFDFPKIFILELY